MILSPTIAEKAQFLADTDDSLLPLFPPLERSVIISLKKMIKNKKEAVAGTTAGEHSKFSEGAVTHATIHSPGI